jgi:TonB family protein
VGATIGWRYAGLRGRHEEECLHFELSVRFHLADGGPSFPATGIWTMSAGTILAPINGPKRKVPRYKLAIPLNLTVLRSGVPDSLYGRTLEIGEGGLGVVVASQLLLGESVRVEFLLPHMTTPVRATAVVRYRHAMCFGLQFLRLPDEQQSIIRYWTRREAEVQLVSQKHHAPPIGVPLAQEEADEEAAPTPLQDLEESAFAGQGFRVPRLPLLVVCILGLAAALGWWRWQQGWTELEAQVPVKAIAPVPPQLQVAADLMQQRLRHDVRPEYPEAARQAGVQGMVVLDAVISAEGAVTQVKTVSGPEALALAAADAVRWWRYEPYVVNGQPVPVETTIMVNYRLSN